MQLDHRLADYQEHLETLLDIYLVLTGLGLLVQWDEFLWDERSRITKQDMAWIAVMNVRRAMQAKWN